MDRFLSPPEHYLPAITRYNFYDSVSHFPVSSTPPSVDFHSFQYSLFPSLSIVPLSPEMESVKAVEKILKYNFRNKSLLKDSLTLSSLSYERFEFLGDMALGLAFSNHLYLVYPKLEPHKLSLLRAANVSTEKLARVAVKSELYRFLIHNSPTLDERVKEFSEAVGKEGATVAYGGLVKAPKVLADLFEAIVGAVYLDLNFDLQRLWMVFRALLEPIFTVDDLQQQPQPVTMLFELCHKHDKRIDVRYMKDGKSNIAAVYVDDEYIASGCAENKDIAKLIASKEALQKLSALMPTEMNIDEDIQEVELEFAKSKLNEICAKKKWPKQFTGIP